MRIKIEGYMNPQIIALIVEHSLNKLGVTFFDHANFYLEPKGVDDLKPVYVVNANQFMKDYGDKLLSRKQ